ncbi:hypothetical protein Chor_002777 [Crotalus horridus]
MKRFKSGLGVDGVERRTILSRSNDGSVAQQLLAESKEEELRIHVMGKNKVKGLKQANVFHIANKKILKAKSKAKPVATNLKKINIVNDEKVHKIDKVFTEIQKNVKQLSKTVPSDSSKKLKIPMSQEDKPANVDAAANLLSQL